MNAALMDSWVNTSWIPKASRVRGLTKMFILITGLWGVGLCVAGFKTAMLLPDYSWTSSGVGFVGILMIVASVVGVLAFWHRRTTRMLLFFCSLALLAVFTLLVLAGASLFNRQQVALFIDDSWDLPVEIGWPANYNGVLRNLYSDAGASTANSGQRLTGSTLQSYMTLIACISWCTACLLLSASRHVADVVGTKRAMENMLETVNMMMLPIGLLSVMAGQFIADSATLASSSITAFVLAISGIMLMALSFLGCFGTAVDSRGVLKVYALINFILGVALVSSGIGTMVVAERMQLELTAKWEQLRVLLPPTFKGKYDRAQFSAFVEANLFLLGYTAIVFGGVLGFQWYAAQRLRTSLKQETRKREAEIGRTPGAAAPAPKKRASLVRQASNRVAQFTQSFAQNPANLLKEQFRERYKKGSARQRKIFKVGGMVCCLVLLCVIAVVVAALVFSTLCDRLDRSSTFAHYTLSRVVGDEVVLANSYRTGQTVVLAPDTNSKFPFTAYADGHAHDSPDLSKALKSELVGGIVLEQFALTTDQAEGQIQCSGFSASAGASECSGQGAAMQLSPSEPNRIMGLDTSCQLSSMYMMWPAADAAPPTGLEFSTIADVMLGDVKSNVSLATRQLSLAGINGTTDFGHVEARNLLIGQQGATVGSRGGDLRFSDVEVFGSTAHSGGDNTVFSVAADLGAVVLERLTVRDASVEARANNALVGASMVVATASLGAAPLAFHNNKGSVVLDNVEGTWIDVSTTEGLVKVSDVTQQSSSTRTARLKIATDTGAVTVRQLRTDGSISIETQAADVTVQLLPLAGRQGSYTGLYSLHTRGTGSANIRLGSIGSGGIEGQRGVGGSNDFFERHQDTKHLQEGGINCGRSGSNDCPYTGGLRITTHVKGNINVIIGCDKPGGCNNCGTPLCTSSNTTNI